MKRKSTSQSSPDEASYEVGYGKPPKHTQFKPGRSGNPRGRPGGHRNLRSVIRSTLNENVTIREGERTRKISTMEAVVRRCVNNALKGEPKAFAALLQLVRSTGLLDEDPEPSSAQSVSAEDEAILATFIERSQSKSHAIDSEDPQAKAARRGPDTSPSDKA